MCSLTLRNTSPSAIQRALSTAGAGILMQTAIYLRKQQEQQSLCTSAIQRALAAFLPPPALPRRGLSAEAAAAGAAATGAAAAAAAAAVASAGGAPTLPRRGSVKYTAAAMCARCAASMAKLPAL